MTSQVFMMKVLLCCLSTAFFTLVVPAVTAVDFPRDATADDFPRGGVGGPLVAVPSPPASVRPQDSCVKIVYCLEGNAMDSTFTTRMDSGNTCAAECDGNCCNGNNPCGFGRFSVCADQGDGSCTGEKACHYVGRGSTVGLISGGSCVGKETCSFAGSVAGSFAGSDGAVGRIFNSCKNGYRACYAVGYDGGIVGDLSNSCQGKESCISLGRMGIVGNVSGGSCVGKETCRLVGFQGIVGDLSNSCFGENTCKFLAYMGNVGSVLDSCKDDRACYLVGGRGGIVVHITGSCKQERACMYLMHSNAQFKSSLQGCCNNAWECQQAGCNNTDFCSSPSPSLPETCTTAPATATVSVTATAFAGLTNLELLDDENADFNRDFENSIARLIDTTTVKHRFSTIISYQITVRVTAFDPVPVDEVCDKRHRIPGRRRKQLYTPISYEIQTAIVYSGDVAFVKEKARDSLKATLVLEGVSKALDSEEMKQYGDISASNVEGVIYWPRRLAAPATLLNKFTM